MRQVCPGITLTWWLLPRSGDTIAILIMNTLNISYEKIRPREERSLFNMSYVVISQIEQRIYLSKGAFLVPYFIMLAIEGIPMFYLELAIGQRLRKGAIGVWNQVSPFLAGIGISSAVVSFNVALYYNTIIAWCLFYFVQVQSIPVVWSSVFSVVAL